MELYLDNNTNTFTNNKFTINKYTEEFYYRRPTSSDYPYIRFKKDEIGLQKFEITKPFDAWRNSYVKIYTDIERDNYSGDIISKNIIMDIDIWLMDLLIIDILHNISKS